jgi:hypothetical protein
MTPNRQPNTPVNPAAGPVTPLAAMTQVASDQKISARPAPVHRRGLLAMR